MDYSKDAVVVETIDVLETAMTRIIEDTSSFKVRVKDWMSNTHSAIEKPPRSPADFLPSTKVVVEKQDSAFQNWEVFGVLQKIYCAVVEL